MSEMFNPSGLQVAWDNSSITIFKECPQKYKLAIVDGWRINGEAAPLAWGGAYHDCLDVYDGLRANGASVDEALLAACRKALVRSDAPIFKEDTRRTRLTLLRALVWYSEQFRSDPLTTHILSSGKPAVELSFRVELPAGPRNSSDPYLYCGHMDKMVDYNGATYVLERKSTVSTLGDNVFDRYVYSAQIAGYNYAGKIAFSTPTVGSFIEVTQTAVNFARFSRREITRVNAHTDEWLNDLIYWLDRVEEAHERNYWPHNTESCSKYSGCQFRDVCFRAPEIRESILHSGYHIERWDPTINR